MIRSGTVERCLACEADRSEPLVGGEAPERCDTQPAPKNDLDVLRRIKPGNSPSRGSKTWHRIRTENTS